MFPVPAYPYGPDMRVVIALGGNAMTAADGAATPADQLAAVSVAAEHIAELVAQGADVTVTHGNGPQVGNLLVKNEVAAGVVPPVPLDWCGAQTQGTIGFILVDALERALEVRGVQRRVAALVSRTLVDGDDPGFVRPVKPVGRYLSEAEARPLIEHGQTWEDRGERGWRRVVASPRPREILDVAAIRALSEQGFVVVACGGGGIPVARDADGVLHGVEAVIDKDTSAALLASMLDADVLVIATDVEHALLGYGTPQARDLGALTVAEMRRHAADGHFAGGSMGPKVEAACSFVEHGAQRGARSVITSLARITDAMQGSVGTTIHAS
jgi:carbamate kinase